MKRRVREDIEAREKTWFAPKAMLSSQSRGREEPEEPCPVRTAFQRDRDRIVHSKSFRRLKGKTQVFLAPEGDHYRTRMTHTLEVCQIGRTIARALRLNEDLVEASALGHDLGHTPFGHAGEEVLDRLLAGGFHHNLQSVRVVERLENDGRGLNLTWEVRDAIGRHSKGRKPLAGPGRAELPATLEGQLVRLADIAAYVNHDLDDAIRGGMLTLDDVPRQVVERLGSTHRDRIHTLVCDIIDHSDCEEDPRVEMSEDVLKTVETLRDFLYDHLYFHPQIFGEFDKTRRIMEDLWAYFMADAERFYDEYWPLGRRETSLEIAVADFLAGMTDIYAISLFAKLFMPKRWIALP